MKEVILKQRTGGDEEDKGSRQRELWEQRPVSLKEAWIIRAKNTWDGGDFDFKHSAQRQGGERGVAAGQT